MNPTEIIERATEGGVLLALSPSGNISAKGILSAIDRWLPALRQGDQLIPVLILSHCAVKPPFMDGH